MSNTQVPLPVSEAAPALSDTHKGGLNSWIAAGLTACRQQAWMIAIMLGYIIFGYTIGRWSGQVVKLSLYSEIMLWLFLVFAVFAIAVRGAGVLSAHKPAKPVAFLAADFKAFYLVPDRILSPLPYLILLPSFISVVSSFKRLIPKLTPYKWDRDFAEFDRFLHGGVHPWELIQPILGTPFATRLISDFYSYSWFIVVAMMQFWFIFTSNPDRQRLLLTNVLSWIILGNVAAISLASAGPVYFEHFTQGANPYSGLMAYLAMVNGQAALSAVTTQDYLWSTYLADNLTPGSGISAMPSMHLSMGTMLVLCAHRIDRRLLYLALGYLIFLELGSVHLGWHYAIDGYAGIAGTLLIWWGLGYFLPAQEQVENQVGKRQPV